MTVADLKPGAWVPFIVTRTKTRQVPWVELAEMLRSRPREKASLELRSSPRGEEVLILGMLDSLPMTLAELGAVRVCVPA